MPTFAVVLMLVYQGPRTVSPEHNQDELNRVVSELNRITNEARAYVTPLPVQPIIRAGVAALKFDALNRVAPPAAGLSVLLPDASAAEAGKAVEVAVMSAAGAVTYVATTGLVNTAASVTVPAAIELRCFRWDGQGWWT